MSNKQWKGKDKLVSLKAFHWFVIMKDRWLVDQDPTQTELTNEQDIQRFQEARICRVEETAKKVLVNRGLLVIIPQEIWYNHQ